MGRLGFYPELVLLRNWMTLIERKNLIQNFRLKSFLI